MHATSANPNNKSRPLTLRGRSNAITCCKRIYYREKYSLASARRIHAWRHLDSIRSPSVRAPIDPDFGRRLTIQFSDEVWRGIDTPDMRRFITARAFPNDDDMTRDRHPYFRSPDSEPIFTTANVSEQFRRIRNCTAGPDGIYGRLLFSARDALVPVFVNIFNFCSQYSFHPFEWSRANITAIPKIPNPAEPMDYRPISITSAVCKMMERIITRLIFQHTKAIWRANKQFGFLPGRCTMDAVIKVIDDWGYAFDSNNKLLAIFFDFAKAFDLVNHEVLLDKIKRKQLLPDWLISWIAAYLSHRWQRVVIDMDEDAAWKRVRAGVIQGSVLGPILFLLFIADINEYVERVAPTATLLKYADDILCYISGKDAASPLPQAIVDAVDRWCIDNKMHLNTNKCKLLALRCLSATDRPIVNLNGSVLEYVDSYKYLGVNLNTEMRPDQQWDLISPRLNSLPYLVKQLKLVGWSTSMLVSAYRAHGLSHFVYSAPVLTSCTKRSKGEMASIQRQVLRAIGISEAHAADKYNIRPIHEFIDDICARTLERILSDDEHPIHVNLVRNDRGTNFARRARFDRYNYSFLVKFMRLKREAQRRRNL